MISLNRVYNSRRTGSAMVELVIGMFPLVLMFGLLLWISQFAWQLPGHQCSVRNKVWSQRYNGPQSGIRVFDFQDKSALEELNKTRVIGIGPAFDLFPDISAFNWVLTSSWDHRILKLDRPPHWTLAKELSLKAIPERAGGLIAAIPPRIGSFTDLVRDEALDFAGSLESARELVEELEQFLPGVRAKNNERELESQLERERARREFEESREPLVAEASLARQKLVEHDQLIQQRVEELEAEQSKLANADEAEKEKIQERIDAIEDEVLPRLREDRIELVAAVEKADQQLRDFDSLEPPPID